MSATTSARVGAARHGARVVQHVVERHRQRVLVAEHHHADRVADEQHVHAGAVEQPRHRGVVGGEHRDLLAAPLLLAQVGHAHFGVRSSVSECGGRQRTAANVLASQLLTASVTSLLTVRSSRLAYSLDLAGHGGRQQVVDAAHHHQLHRLALAVGARQSRPAARRWTAPPRDRARRARRASAGARLRSSSPGRTSARSASTACRLPCAGSGARPPSPCPRARPRESASAAPRATARSCGDSVDCSSACCCWSRTRSAPVVPGARQRHHGRELALPGRGQHAPPTRPRRGRPRQCASDPRPCDR